MNQAPYPPTQGQPVYQQPAPQYQNAPPPQYGAPPAQGGRPNIDPEMASVFAQIAQANPNGGRANLIDGNYDLVVRKVIAGKFTNSRCFVVEFGVLASVATVQGIMPHPPGGEFGWAVSFDGGGHKSAPGNVMAFMLAAYGLTVDKLNRATIGDDLAYLSQPYDPHTGQGQPLIGKIIRCNTYRKKKKNKPDDPEMVLPNWIFVQQDPADWQRRRQEIIAGGTGQLIAGPR